MLSLTTPANDLNLLTAAELRTAVGLSSADASADAKLTPAGLRVSALIARACGVAQAGVAAPTLRSEVLSETIRLSRGVESLILARRFVSAIGSVVEDGVTLDTDEYEFDQASGMLFRLSSDDQRVFWPATKIVVAYTAGFVTVPDDIKLAASKLVADVYTTSGRDPNLRRERVEGVGENEFWVPPTTDPAVPQEVLDILAAYMTVSV